MTGCSPYVSPGLCRHNEVIIQQVVSSFYDISVLDIVAKTKKRDIVWPRQLCMYFENIYTNKPLQMIADDYSMKSHATVLHAIKTIRNDSDKNGRAFEVRQLRDRLDIYLKKDQHVNAGP